jgi:hypothetical protein
MKLIKKSLDKFNGLHYPQEYICFAKESFQSPIHAYLVYNKKIIGDITKLHSFVGYSPLVFALAPTPEIIIQQETIDIVFTHDLLDKNATFNEKDALAFLSLRKIRRQLINDVVLTFYEGVNGKHRFISSFHQCIIQLNNQLYNQKPGNVFLEENLYKQVQIAYSIPRMISLITVTQKGLFNLFPTDLHGPAGDQHYIVSLRHEGKASEQVENAGKILLTNVKAGFYKQVYGLGKNHMQPLKTKDLFPFSDETSLNFSSPLPQSALEYRELEWQASFMRGIHKIHLFKVVFHKKISDVTDTLAHVHNSYATWRHNEGWESNYLLR